MRSPEGTFHCLRKIIEGEEDPERAGEIIGGVRSPKDAIEIRGQAGRALESTPDHPGLFILRGVSEMMCPDAQSSIAIENILAAHLSAGTFGIELQVMAETLKWALSIIHQKVDSDTYAVIATGILTKINDSWAGADCR